MKEIFLLFLFFSTTYCSAVIACYKQNSCFTKNFYNQTERHVVHCPYGMRCSGYICMINNVIYKSSGCGDDDHGICQHNKEAVIIAKIKCSLPYCERTAIDMDLMKYRQNLSDKPCYYEPIKNSYFTDLSKSRAKHFWPIGPHG